MSARAGVPWVGASRFRPPRLGDQTGGPQSDYQACYAHSFAYLWNLMDSLKDADGNTVLDNSISIFTNSDGMYAAHWASFLPTITAGSAGGRLKTGYYLDYTTRAFNHGNIDPTPYTTGYPYNNWLITLFRVFGLEPSDYETVPGMGYGESWSGRTKYIPPEVLTTEGRRSPLPFIWKG